MKQLLFCVLFLALTTLAHAQGECPGQHCSIKFDTINKICTSAGQQGQVVYVEYNGGFCWCKCSCLAASTPVAITDKNWKAIGEIKIGETVLALGSDGKWKSAPVVYSDGTKNPQKPYPYAIYVGIESGMSIVATADHLFLLSSGDLRRADRLSPDDQLMGADMKPVKIIALTHGSYLGPIHHIAATKWDQSAVTRDGHLINTSGVVSGDYFLQVNQPDANKSLPQIGTSAYESKYSAKFSSLAGRVPATITLSDKASFTSYKKLLPPSNSTYFLPPGQDEAAEGALSPLDNTVPYEMAEYLVGHYKRFYPDVQFQIDWANDTVNAWANVINGKRVVTILGGLLRHWAVKQEGAGLVLSHELGHHYGGDPRYPNSSWGASCEGQSDYWGALIAQRTVWWGQYALQQTDAGSQQLYNLFAYGLKVGNLFSPDVVKRLYTQTAGCTHPPAQCRYDTYRAAMRLDAKPGCAN